MKLEQQVISLELAKRLKELGLKHDSLWMWAPSQIKGMSHTLKLNRGDSSSEYAFAAFTVAELGEMLPPKIKHQGCDWLLMLAAPFNAVWIVYYQVDEGTDKIRDGNRWIMAEKEADARAKMLIHLLENKLITI